MDSDSSLSFTNLDKDQTASLVTLTNNETLNGVSCDPESSSTSFRIGWDDNDTIRYGVYDNTKCLDNGQGVLKHPFIEYRTIKIPN